MIIEMIHLETRDGEICIDPSRIETIESRMVHRIGGTHGMVTEVSTHNGEVYEVRESLSTVERLRRDSLKAASAFDVEDAQ